MVSQKMCINLGNGDNGQETHAYLTMNTDESGFNNQNECHLFLVIIFRILQERPEMFKETRQHRYYQTR